jgi:hypothetical protein
MSKGRGNSSKIDENSITAWRRKNGNLCRENAERNFVE